MRLTALFASVIAVSGPLGQAMAACPQELAVYSEVNGETGLEFRPNIDLAIASNVFRLLLRDGPVLEGYASWHSGGGRSDGVLQHECPEGDMTAEEIEACTPWQGLIYAVDEDNMIGLLPAEGEPAAARLVLADISRALHFSPLENGTTKLPAFDVFALSGCQE